MLRNPNYVYGPRNVVVPANINFGDYILEQMWTHRQKIAMINGATDERLTYSDIIQQSMNFAVSLNRMGVKKGDTIGLLSENRQEFWGAVIGVACSGAVLTTISTGYVKGEIIHVTNISKPKYIICSPIMYKNHSKTLKSLNFVKDIILFGAEKQNGVTMYNDLVFESNGFVKNVEYGQFHSVEVQGQSDTLFIMYSSGTTGLPKGVMTTHLNVITACCLPASHDPNSMTVTITPWYHVMGLVGTLTAFITGRTGVYLPKFEVDLYLKTIEKYKAVQLTVVPPVLVAVTKKQTQYDLSSVKMIYSGAAPLHKDTIKAVHEKFPNLQGIYQGYGSTELTLAVLRFSVSDSNVHKLGSVGTVSPNTVIKVPPAELEAVLLQHEGIKDAAVIGIEDKSAGEVPLAFVVAQPGVTEDDVKKFVAERLSNPKHLRGGVRFVAQIPKSPSGKILRKDLRKLLKTAKSKL